MNRYRNKCLPIVFGVALAISSAACNRDGRTLADGDQARGHEGAPINLTGCLQKDPGIVATYILTQVNEPTRSVGTSGSSADASPDVVDQQRMRQAKHSYRLDGDNDELEKMVGKQVRVEGKIDENSDLHEKADDEKPRDVTTGDLAQVDVTSIVAVADACGQAK